MKHSCFGPKNVNWRCVGECICDCRSCSETRRMDNLPALKDDEIEALEKMLDASTPGPWNCVQLDGFGNKYFIKSTSKFLLKGWYEVVAQAENAGGFGGVNFIAWCRDGVPRMIKKIRELKEENDYLRGLLKIKNK